MFSDSRLKTYMECPRKYRLRYLDECQKDPDWTESKSRSFGKLVHKILERTKHNPKNYSLDILKEEISFTPFSFAKEGAQIAAMLRSYYSGADDSLESIAQEIHWESKEDDLNGYIDAIFKQKEGEEWWIIDIKTNGGNADPVLPARLRNDQQISLYVNYRDIVAKLLGLKSESFKGFRYRELFKPKQKYKQNESFVDFTQRCKCSYREIIIPIEEINYVSIMENVREIISTALTTKYFCQNFYSCLKFGSVCEFWSRCHGCSFSSITNPESQEESVF